jgi:hypothetical protein
MLVSPVLISNPYEVVMDLEVNLMLVSPSELVLISVFCEYYNLI